MVLIEKGLSTDRLIGHDFHTTIVAVGMRLVPWLFLFLMWGVPSVACLWDRDTLAYEAKGLPGIVEIGAGRIERMPPLYYEMRIQRLEPQLENTGDLDLFDDVAVAYDRLGNPSRALEIMDDKWARFGAQAAVPANHRHYYRYLANTGTFHAHRRLKKGTNRDTADDLKRASQMIGKALEIEPNAHFGREAVQLHLINFLQDPHYPDPDDTHLGWGAQVDETLTIEGLTGLMVLGNAWESADVVRALSNAVNLSGNSMTSGFLMLRYGELVAAGKPPLTGTMGELNLASFLSMGIAPQDFERMKAYFWNARENVERWRSHREDYILKQLHAGVHPDTHPDFWVGHREVPFLKPPNRYLMLILSHVRATVFAGSVLLLLPALLMLSFLWKGRGKAWGGMAFLAGALCLPGLTLVPWILLDRYFDLKDTPAALLLVLCFGVWFWPMRARLRDLQKPAKWAWLAWVPAVNFALVCWLGFASGVGIEGNDGDLRLSLRKGGKLAVVLLYGLFVLAVFLGIEFAEWFR